MDVESALTVAAARLGYAELKDKQKEAIKAFASGKDVFVSIASKYTDLPVFLLKSDCKYWQKFENTENLENWHNTSYMELEAKW